MTATASNTAKAIKSNRTKSSPAKAPYPEQILEGLVWSLDEHLSDDYLAFKKKLETYAHEVGADFDASALDIEFPSLALDVGCQYCVTDRAGNFREAVAVAHIRSDTKLSHGEILHRALLDISPRLQDDNYFFVEAFRRIEHCLTEGVPVYQIFLGS